MIKYEVYENIFTIPEETGSGSIQLNYMKWGNNSPKHDLRKWSGQDEPMKGITLSDDQLRDLYEGLKEYFEEDDDGGTVDPPIDKECNIDFRGFLVHSDDCPCKREGHDIESIKAQVYIFNKKMTEIEISASYCRDCKAYYITEHWFNYLKKLGTIMCQVFSQESFEKYIEGGGAIRSSRGVYSSSSWI